MFRLSRLFPKINTFDQRVAGIGVGVFCVGGAGTCLLLSENEPAIHKMSPMSKNVIVYKTRLVALYLIHFPVMFISGVLLVNDSISFIQKIITSKDVGIIVRSTAIRLIYIPCWIMSLSMMCLSQMYLLEMILGPVFTNDEMTMKEKNGHSDKL